jgi:hypothetical protein
LGDLVYLLSSSDTAVSGLTASDFSASNGAVVGALQPVASQAGKYTLSVTPTANGELVVSAAQGAGTSATNLPTLATASSAVNVIKGSISNDSLDLTSLKEIVVLGGGKDVVKVDSVSDSLASARDLVAGVSSDDVIDMTALFNKIGTVSQYFSVVDSSYTGQPVAGWLQAVDKLPTESLGTPGDNQIFFSEKVEGNQLTLSMVFDTDSRLGTTTVSEVAELRVLAADAAALQGFLNNNTNNDYVLVDKIAPTISVAMEAGKTTFAKTNPGTGVVSFTSNEIIGALPASALTVVNGALSVPVRSSTNPLVWTSTFTPDSNASLTSASISVKASGYTDGSGNLGAASNTQNLSINVAAPSINLKWDDVSPDGTLTFRLESSQALTGLDKSDFSLPGQTILTFQKVSGSALPEAYEGTVLPSASGNLTLTLPAGVATVGQLPTQAVVADPATINFVKSAGDGQPIVLSGPSGEVTPKMILLASGNETIRVTGVGTAASTPGATNFMGILVGANAGDKLDISPVLTGFGYTSQAVADVADTGAGFIEIKNLVLTNPTATTSTVKFDITLDSSNYLNNKVSGLVIDLDYDTSKVASGSVSSITVDGVVGSDATYSPIVRNIAPVSGSTALVTGKIAAPVDTAAPSNALVIDSTGKALGVTLQLNSAETSFRVALQSKAAGGETQLTTSAGSYDVDVGIAKTARLAGTSAGPTANALEVVVSKQTKAFDTANPSFGTSPTDNQFKLLQIIESSEVSGQTAKYGTLLFQFDTNPAVGTTALSPVVEAVFASNDISAFFNSEYAKFI